MKKIIIIGAGPAGVTAGYELMKQSMECQVVILEESSAIGGISRTVCCNGNRMDIGGHRFFSKDNRVMDWWRSIMPLQGKPSYDDRITGRRVDLSDSGPDPEEEERVMLSRRRVSRIYYKKKFFDYPVRMNMNTIRNMGFATTMEAGFSYLGSAMHKLPETSLENFYVNRFGRKLYSMFFEGYTEKLWGRHPREISADWGAQRIKGLSIKAVLKDIITKPFVKDSSKVETSLIEEFYYPKYGPGQLWETVASEFEAMGGIIKRNCRVTRINTSDGVVRSVEYVDNGQVKCEEGDCFISSMPLKDLIEGIESVPENIRGIASGLPYRDFVTVGLLLNKLNLKNETKLETLGNIVPDCWIYVQDTGVKLGRIQIFNNWSPYMVKSPEKTIWIGLEYFCREGDDFWSKDNSQLADYAMRELAAMGVVDSKEHLLDFHCEKVKKAYPAYFDTYKDIDKLIEWLDKLPNLYCVGRNGQHRYNNMDHSMVTSFEAVKNILGGIADKSNVWNVNTEKEYHEEKTS